ncbi:MAG: hypothetical protein ACON5C_09545 [Alphaproteobacteria bacterium]
MTPSPQDNANSHEDEREHGQKKGGMTLFQFLAMLALVMLAVPLTGFVVVAFLLGLAT